MARALKKQDKTAAGTGAGKQGRKKTITAEERARMISMEAYFRAERRGFQGGNPEQDWIEAEKAINARLSAGR